MADPKYAGLPGIVHDQPDVYETSDLPESDQHELGDSIEGSDAVEVLHISATDAHAKFADKLIDASRVDFSDRISKKTRTGYQARRIEWELAGEEKEENVVQRYNRLMCEVAALQQDILQIKEKGLESVPYTETDGEENKSSTVSAVELEQQSQQLQNQLLQLQLEKQLGVETVEGLSQPHLSAHKRLTALIDAVKQTKKSSTNASDETKGASTAGAVVPAGAGMSYQMFYSPEMAKLNQLGPVLLLEKRIEKLEKLLGNDQEKLSRLWSWTREGSVLGAVSSLGQRLALLEPSQLDHIEGRLHAVHTKMNAIAEKSQGTAEKETKIQELYELVQKCWVLCGGMPELVERLEALQGLHTEAGKFGRTLQQLDVAQTQLTSSLASNERLLTSVQDKFVDNLAAVNASIASLDSRIQALGASATK